MRAAKAFYEKTKQLRASAKPTIPELAGASRTELGRVLREHRRKIVAGGTELLDWNDLDREIAERRGE